MSKGKRGAGRGKKKRGRRGGRAAPDLIITLDGRELPALCPHDISIHAACESCGRVEERF